MKAWLILISILASGCGSVVPAPEARDLDALGANAAWQRVLSRSVDDQGRVDLRGLQSDPRDLEAYVRFVAEVSPLSHPTLFPSVNHVLAFHINAYNALAMYNMVRMKPMPETLGGGERLKTFVLRRLEVGDSYLSLYDYENRVIRALGEERIHFALNCLVRGCPRLPREPFTAEKLEAQLEREANRFFNEDRNVQVDRAARVVRFNQILQFYTRDFLAKTPSLIAYANRYRKDKLPEDFKVEFIPYDWTVNYFPPR